MLYDVIIVSGVTIVVDVNQNKIGVPSESFGEFPHKYVL